MSKAWVGVNVQNYRTAPIYSLTLIQTSLYRNPPPTPPIKVEGCYSSESGTPILKWRVQEITPQFHRFTGKLCIVISLFCRIYFKNYFEIFYNNFVQISFFSCLNNLLKYWPENIRINVVSNFRHYVIWAFVDLNIL